MVGWGWVVGNIVCSDHIATLKAYQGWQDAKQNGAELSYCWDNFLSLPTLKMIEGIQHQFLNILVDMNFIDKIHAQHVSKMDFIEVKLGTNTPPIKIYLKF